MSSKMDYRSRGRKVQLSGRCLTSALGEGANPGISLPRRRKAVRNGILFVSGGDEYGGAEKHLIDVIGALSGLGVRTSILCVRKDVYTGRLDQAELRGGAIHEIPIRGPLEWFRVLRMVRPEAIVFVRSWLACLPWYTSIVALCTGIRRRFSIIHLPPTPLPEAKDWSIANHRWQISRLRKRLALRRAALCCSRTVCVSDAIRNALIRDFYFPAKTTITIHNGVDLSGRGRHEGLRQALRARLGLKSTDFVLVCVGRLTEQKGIDVLLTALGQVVREGLPAKCIIVGDGPLRESLQKQAVDLGVTDHVFFEGFRDNVQQYLNGADAFVLASRIEGLPLSILEAMASGLPCLVTDVGGNSEVVTTGVDGLVVPALSSDAVADGIRYLATHPQERRRMSAKARTKMYEHFNIEHAMSEITQIVLS
jgi:glycosyltransferase involved in cell wall biosynthesis